MTDPFLPSSSDSPKLTSADQAAVAAYPELRRLIDLRNGGGWFFQPVQVHGELELLAGARFWPEGWSDALAIRNVGDAKAFRCDSDGGVVWQCEGGLIAVIDGLERVSCGHDRLSVMIMSCG